MNNLSQHTSLKRRFILSLKCVSKRHVTPRHEKARRAKHKLFKHTDMTDTRSHVSPESGLEAPLLMMMLMMLLLMIMGMWCFVRLKSSVPLIL